MADGIEGWSLFRRDIDRYLPSKYRSEARNGAGGHASVPAHIQPGESVFDERDERHEMHEVRQ